MVYYDQWSPVIVCLITIVACVITFGKCLLLVAYPFFPVLILRLCRYSLLTSWVYYCPYSINRLSSSVQMPISRLENLYSTYSPLTDCLVPLLSLVVLCLFEVLCWILMPGQHILCVFVKLCSSDANTTFAFVFHDESLSSVGWGVWRLFTIIGGTSAHQEIL